MAQELFSADELSRGSQFWRKQYVRGQKLFSRVNWDKAGWDKAQEFTDRVSRYRNLANACLTFGPCSRTIYLEQVAK